MGPVNAQRVDDDNVVFLNVTGLAPTCTHKYVYHGQHDDDIKIYVHVNMLFPACLIRKVPMHNAVLQVEATVVPGLPFDMDRSKRVAQVSMSCTTLGGNLVFTGMFKDAPLKALHFKDKVKRSLIDSGKCSTNTHLNFVMTGDMKALRGNAMVWKGTAAKAAVKTKGVKVVGREVMKKQLKLQSFSSN